MQEASENKNGLVGCVSKLSAEYWVMEPKQLQSFFSHLASLQSDIEAADKSNGKKYSVKNGIAHIPIKGILIKEVPRIFTFFGIQATSYLDIEQQVKQAVSDPKVKSIVLDVDSPGGLVSGVMETADAIRAAREIKPVTAVVDEIAASGAYWLASQASIITASRTAQIGSIGVFSVYVDYSDYAKKIGAKVHVIKSGEHKGMGVVGAPITEKQIAGIQNIIDQLAENFVDSVVMGRGKKKKDIEKCATGQIWLSGEAMSLGLIDNVYKNNVDVNKIIKGITMEQIKNEQTDAQIDVTKITDQVQNDDRQKLKEMQAAFPDDPTYAIEAFSAGKTVTEAKADYVEVLRDKLSSVTQQRDEAKASAANAQAKQDEKTDVADGIEPVENKASDTAENATGDFIAEAIQMAADEKIERTAAIKKLARQKPELYKSWKASLRNSKLNIR